VSDDEFNARLADLDDGLEKASARTPVYALEDLLMTGEDDVHPASTRDLPPPPLVHDTAATTSAALIACVMGFGVGLGGAIAVVVFRDRVAMILGF